MTTNTEQTTVEHGLLFEGDELPTWADEDGELYVNGGYTRQDSPDLPSVVEAHNASAISRKAQIVSRQIVTKPWQLGPQLPTTPGSLVAATVDGNRGLYVLDGWSIADGQEAYWSLVSNYSGDFATVLPEPEQLKDVVVVFVAPPLDA